MFGPVHHASKAGQPRAIRAGAARIYPRPADCDDLSIFEQHAAIHLVMSYDKLDFARDFTPRLRRVVEMGIDDAEDIVFPGFHRALPNTASDFELQHPATLSGRARLLFMPGSFQGASLGAAVLQVQDPMVTPVLTLLQVESLSLRSLR